MSQQNKEYHYESDSDDLEDADSDDETFFDPMDPNYTVEGLSDDESSYEYENEDPELLLNVINDPEVTWINVPPTFTPRKTVPEYKEPEIQFDENFLQNCNELDLFFKLFPKSLIMWITSCTNERLKILSEKKGKEIKPADSHEIMIVIGCTLIMAFNRVPEMQMYWSNNKSLENSVIKSAIARDRFLLLASKLYFNKPVKPDGASKTYYMDELVNCLKYTFQRARSEATYQSIDESMIKCKARTVLKQFMKDKPVKRGAKVWQRCDAMSGYVYDMNIYQGKDTENLSGTLGERVVTTLCNTLREQDVTIIVDRFFMSVILLKTLPHALVGTCMKNRKNVPQMDKKLERGESEAKCTSDGIICFKWRDTKEFLLMSNCHKNIIKTADRKQKDGSMKTYDCPEAIVFYNAMMGGVDKSDQYSTCYEVDRKSNKWWRRAFHRFLLIAVSNSWIIFKQLRGQKTPLIDFLIVLAEDMIEVGKKGTSNLRRPGVGRPSKRRKFMEVVTHQPIPADTRRRCTFCASKKIYTRTKWLCNTCELPLCVQCFFPFHQT